LIQKILNIQTKRISSASLILFGSYLFSAVLGLLRDRLLAGKLGAGRELDVYYAAFTVPDLIAVLFILGGISAAIVPVFSSYWVQSKGESWQYLANLFNILATVLIVICLFLIVFAPFFVSFIVPGFSVGEKDDTVLLMRIMFLSPILLGISNIISSILQLLHRFLVTALSPLFYNLGIIIGILFLLPFFGLVGLAFGVVLGGFLHLLIQIPVFFYSGFRYQAVFNIKHPGLLKTLKLMVPRSLGLAAGQVNTIVIVAIASTLTAGSVAVFNLANNLSLMMVNAAAVSLSTAVFPVISLAYSRKNQQEFNQKFSIIIRQIMFLTVPAAILLFVLRAQIIRVVLGTGKFGWIDTRLTAACLGIFTVGLLGQALILIFSKTFYAAHNTKIPSIISIATVFFNIAVSLFFVRFLGSFGLFRKILEYVLKLEGLGDIRVVGLALAFSVAATLQAFLLFLFLYKKLKIIRISEILISLYKILLAGVLTMVVTFFVRQVLVDYNIIDLRTFLGVFWQLVISGLSGVFSYILVSHLLKSEELKTIKTSFFRNLGL